VHSDLYTLSALLLLLLLASVGSRYSSVDCREYRSSAQYRGIHLHTSMHAVLEHTVAYYKLAVLQCTLQECI
jgi:hypothetical protein